MYAIGEVVKYAWGKETRTGTIVAWSNENDAWEVTVTSGLNVFLREDEMWPANDAYGHPWSK